MIDIFSLWEKFIGQANTYQGGHVKPQRQFVNWVNDISKNLFLDFTDDAEKTHANSDVLSPFLKSVNVTVTRQPGQFFDLAAKPADYERFSACRAYMAGKDFGGKVADHKFYGDQSKCLVKDGKETKVLTDEEQEFLSEKAIESVTEITIEKIESSKWAAALAHKNIRPTLRSPKCTPFDKGLKLAPKDIPIIVLDYYRLPKEAVFNYSIANAGTETEYIAFNPTGSQNLEWSSTLTSVFVERLVQRYGLYVREREVSVGATEIK